MSEFELKVHEAIRGLLVPHAYAEGVRMKSWISGPEYVAEKLAPRVAAAILKAVGAYDASMYVGTGQPDDEAEDAAIKALRGEVS